MNYILELEHSIIGFMPKDHLKTNVGCVTSFKIIEERDEIVEMNEQLESDL
jgi:hypothetical protein